jgi:hypothetical protein
MKNYRKTLIVLSIFLLVVSCKMKNGERNNNKNESEDIITNNQIDDDIGNTNNFILSDEIIEINGKNIFDIPDIFKNISEDPNSYKENNNYLYKEYYSTNQYKKDFDAIFVSNDEISIKYDPENTFYPADPGKYIFRKYTIMKQTENYYFGKYIGQTGDEILKIFPNYSEYKEGKYIIYNSIDMQKYIYFELKDNRVLEITYAYNL